MRRRSVAQAVRQQLSPKRARLASSHETSDRRGSNLPAGDSRHRMRPPFAPHRPTSSIIRPVFRQRFLGSVREWTYLRKTALRHLRTKASDIWAAACRVGYIGPVDGSNKNNAKPNATGSALMTDRPVE